jgi:hypothetical protein
LVLILHDTSDARTRHADDTSSARAKHVDDTPNAHVRHAHDTLSPKEVEALRELLQEWKSLKGQLSDLEVAASVESVTLEKRWTELDPNVKRSRRAYKVNNEVWQQFDGIVDLTQMEKGQALEVALLDFIERYKHGQK